MPEPGGELLWKVWPPVIGAGVDVSLVPLPDSSFVLLLPQQ
jgi:hypothetical protein